MTQETLVIPGQRGIDIRATVTRSSGRELAVLLPGLTYRNTMPVMHFSRLLMLERGADTIAVDYAYDQAPGFREVPDDEQLNWVGADGRAVLNAALELGPYERLTVIGKSLGTIAMGWAVPGEPRLSGARLVWLTPSLRGTGLQERMKVCSGRSLVVIGTRDPAYDPLLIKAWQAEGVRTIVVSGADHGLERSGDALGSVQVLAEMLTGLGVWLDQSTTGDGSA